MIKAMNAAAANNNKRNPRSHRPADVWGEISFRMENASIGLWFVRGW
jgi:hypothetical protein